MSGGQQTRAALAALLFQKPDLILLDEPTNNLDRDGRQAVADMLAKWQGAAVVVSHDRELLRSMDAIAELSQGALALYGGNWDFYHERKELEREGAARDLELAQRDVKQVRLKAQEAAERQAKSDARGRKSRAGGGMSKLLLDARADKAQKTGGRGELLAERNAERAQSQLQEAEAKVERIKKMRFHIDASLSPSGRVVLEMLDVFGGPAPENPVIRDFSLRIVGPERIAIRGANGAGKTSLLRLISGDLQPVSGEIRRLCRLPCSISR